MEFLVLLDRDEFDGPLSEHARVVHSASPRLHVIRLEASAVQKFESLPGVVELTADSFSPELLERLDDQERLFLEALSRRNAPKQRLGEGLPWDAPGFEPPDPPVESKQCTDDEQPTGCGPDAADGDRHHE
jgi:hypothetical protein